MKAGDRVRFRSGSTAWKPRGLNPDARGTALELYRTPLRGDIMVDVRFGDESGIERGIPVADLEVVPPEWTPPKLEPVERRRR